MAGKLTTIALGDRYWSVKQSTRKLIGVPTVVFANPHSLKRSHPDLPHRLEPQHELIAIG